MKVTKKPVQVEAFRWLIDEVPDWWKALEGTTMDVSTGSAFIKTLEGTMEAKKGDYIIQGVKGEVYPCKSDIFELTYETGDISNISDGYHTFAELYDFRMLYNAAFFNTLAEWQEAEGDQGYNLHKSWRHSDGELCFGGGWFVVVAQLPTGQITNHYEKQHWDMFNILEKKKAAKYDGHTPDDVLDRLQRFLWGERGKK